MAQTATRRKRKPRPKPKSKWEIDPERRKWLDLYMAMINRYQELPLEWHASMTAIRLYCKRVGLDKLMYFLKKYGVALVAEQCRHEMTLREEFFAQMIADFPPDDPAEAQGAIEEIAEDLAMIDSPPGGLRMLRVLDRLLQREQVLGLGNHKVEH